MRFVAILAFWAGLLLGATGAEARPLVVVLASNGGTEITDFLVPYGVISQSGAADVVAVSTGDGPIDFMNGMSARADMTVAGFERAHPKGADYVIVPAFHDPEDAAARDFLRGQAGKGATLMSICDGAIVLAGTGLLDGRRATAHFHSADMRRKTFPKVNWVANTRYVQDGKLITTSGVSASLPGSLYLVEQIAGRARAMELARSMGMEGYSAAHNSDAFRISAGDYWLAATNMLFVWPRDSYAIDVDKGVDEVGLAFAGDMLSRTFRAHVDVVSERSEVRTRHGLRLVANERPDEVSARAVKVRIGGAGEPGMLTVGEGGRAPDDISRWLAQHYKPALARFVMTTMEYPSKPADQDFR
jgi:transcriptional regulator GlxA family with amidase domain